MKKIISVLQGHVSLFGKQISNFCKDSMNNILDSSQSHLTLFAEGYHKDRDRMPTTPFIPDSDRITVDLENLKGVKATESRIRFAATLIRGSDELPCLGIAVDPVRNPKLFNIKECLVDGYWLEEDEGILIGTGLSRDMGLKTGDTLTLRLIGDSSEDGFSWNAMDVVVRGIFDSNNPGIDRSVLFISLETARRALALEGGATEIALKLQQDDDRFISSVKTKLKTAVGHMSPGFEVFSWKELENTFLAVSQMKTRNSSIIIMVMLLIASVGIVNTMLMAVMERTREIGMLAAMGMKSREIMVLFILEGGFIGMIGSFCGCIIGGLISWLLQVYGMSLDSFGQTIIRMSEAIYPVKGTFYAHITLDTLGTVFVFGTAIATLASAWPARKAARMDPIRALRQI